MPTLREVRRRISGVKQTQKITKAMKMVAAAKLRRAQMNVVAARPYARHMRSLLDHLLEGEGQAWDVLTVPRPVRRLGLVVVTADRGLCGAFNSNVVRTAAAHVHQNYPDLMREGRVSVFCVGKRGIEAMVRQEYPVARKYPGIFDHLEFGRVLAIARDLESAYRNGEVDRVDVVYNEFKNVAQQRIVVEQYLPLVLQADETVPRTAPRDYLYEPSRREILSALIPKHLDFQLWRIMLESNASEQGARMTAMEHATSNAAELIESLQLQYNKARQASITKELLEVVSGAEALKGTA
jgi:F-type H+-transporting ATPase subunit gamma